MSIGVGGLISGLDTESLITQMMDLERRPVLTLQKEEAFYQSQITSLGSLKASLSALQTTLTPLQDASNFVSFTASSGNTSVMTVAASDSVAAGQYQVDVTDLAQAQQVRSAAFVDLTGEIGKDQVVGTGTLNLQVGSNTAIDITIDSSNNTLAGIAAAINSNATDVTAAVVDDGTGNYYLTLASKETGLANTITMTIDDTDGIDTDASGLSALYNNPATGTMQETQAAANAQLVLNGIAVERSTNTIDDLVDGLTMTLKDTDAGNPFTITVAENLSSVTDKVQAFVDKYNALNTLLTEYQDYNAVTKEAGPLQGDGTTRMIQERLENLLYAKVDGVASDVNGLSKLGIEQDRNGALTLNSKTLTAALETNREDVTNFFSQTTDGNEGFAVQLDDILDGYISTTGLLEAKKDGLNASIKDVTDQVDRINYRLIQKEETLRQQFDALEILLSDFEKTSGILTGQLDSLSNLNSQIYKK